MSANSFGHIFKLTTFGESHGVALGAVIEGVPAGIKFNEELLKNNLLRRSPGQSNITTSRSEPDQPIVLSGVFEGKTIGTPVSIIVYNKDHKSQDYKKSDLQLRQGHATDLWDQKFGHSDHRGSGRASGRETLSRVIGGSLAQMALAEIYPKLKVFSFVSQVGPYLLKESEVKEISELILKGDLNPDDFITRIPKSELDEKVKHQLSLFKSQGDSFGGMVDLFITGVPAGLGQPVFKKIKSEIASAMMSVGTTQSFEVGFATQSLEKSGKEFHHQSQSYGGVRGGISTGDSLHFRIGFKPPSTIGEMARSGRHDPCILPRVIPVIDAMANLVLIDQVLWTRLDQLK